MDKETFDIVHQIRNKKRRVDKNLIQDKLSELLFCADCGKKLYVIRNKRQKFQNTIHVQLIDALMEVNVQII